MTYRPDWDVDRARGEEAEALYRKLRSDVLSGAAEVKRDDEAHRTRNVYIEYQQKRRDGWHLSGIATTKADTWVIYVQPAFVAVPVPTLLAMSRARWRQGDRRECVVGSHPTKGVVIPLRDLLESAVETWYGTAHGAPTDEPPAPQPADTDSDAALAFGDLNFADTLILPTAEQARDYAHNGTFTPDAAGWTA